MVDGYRIVAFIYCSFNMLSWFFLKTFAGFNEDFTIRVFGSAFLLSTGFLPKNKNLKIYHKIYLEFAYSYVLAGTLLYMLLINNANTFWFSTMVFGGVCLGIKTQPIIGFYTYWLWAIIVTVVLKDSVPAETIHQSYLAHFVYMMIFMVTQIVKVLFLTSSDELMKLKEEAERKQQLEKRQQTRFLMLQETAYSMAHEINNPLAVVSGNLSLLKSALKKNDKDKAERVITKISEATLRIQNVISDLKNFSEKLTQEQVIVEFDLEQIINEAIKVAKHRKGLGVEVVQEHLGKSIITANRSLISLIVYTLLDNSMDRLANVDGGDINIKTSIADGKLLLGYSDSIKDPIDLLNTNFESIALWLDKNNGSMMQKSDERKTLEFSLRLG
jgi:signal transduction histidine kinase